MKHLVVVLFGSQIPHDRHSLALRLVIDKLVAFSGWETDLSARERCSQHLYIICAVLIGWGDAYGDGSCSLDILDGVGIHKIAFHIEDSVKPFRKQLHLTGCAKRQLVSGEHPLEDIHLQIIDHDSLVPVVSIVRHDALVLGLIVGILRNIG